VDGERAKKILGDSAEPDGTLYDNVREFRGYVDWKPQYPFGATLDGDFTADELAAIAWWMRRHGQN